MTRILPGLFLLASVTGAEILVVTHSPAGGWTGPAGTLISNSFFMLEYIAEALPGPSLLPESAYDLYLAHASGQFLGAQLGSLVVNDGVERRLVLYWYQMRSATETDVLPLKIEMTRRALMRQPQEVVFASISTPTGDDVSATMARLSPLAREVHAEIDRLYGEP